MPFNSFTWGFLLRTHSHSSLWRNRSWQQSILKHLKTDILWLCNFSLAMHQTWNFTSIWWHMIYDDICLKIWGSQTFTFPQFMATATAITVMVPPALNITPFPENCQVSCRRPPGHRRDIGCLGRYIKLRVWRWSKKWPIFNNLYIFSIDLNCIFFSNSWGKIKLCPSKMLIVAEVNHWEPYALPYHISFHLWGISGSNVQSSVRTVRHCPRTSQNFGQQEHMGILFGMNVFGQALGQPQPKTIKHDMGFDFLQW